MLFSKPPAENSSTNIVPAGTCEAYENSGPGYFAQGVTCNNYVVEFMSDPPGAKVELGNNYIGVTPCSTKFDGKYSVNDRRYVNAYPVEEGQYEQSKMFPPGEFYPPKMYFNMKVNPAAPAVSVDVAGTESQPK
jgi:hypothetical protein